MIIKSIVDITSGPLFFELPGFLPDVSSFIKLEGLNVAGSIKLTTASGLINCLEQEGKMSSATKLIESSSGNLGVALSILCKEKGYAFTCVTDPNILPENERVMQLYGANVIKVTEKDSNGGYLGSRIKYIQDLLERDPDYLWLNQYANPSNPHAHYSQTGREILKQFPKVDYLFIGAGTTGTLMGCAQLFKEFSPATKVIAIDSVGSVTFGFPAKKRHVPGVGTSRRPEIVDESLLDDIILVDELDGIKMCHFLLERYGLFLGGSSGTVMHGMRTYPVLPPNSIVLGIAPDFGYKYLDTVYSKSWIQEKFNCVL